METNSSLPTRGGCIEGLKVLTGNVRSLRGKLDELAVKVDASGPDIIALTESWLTPEVQDSECLLEGFNIFRADRKSGKIGGGVILYCRTYLNPIMISGMTNEDSSEEFLCCKIKHKEGSSLIGVVYRAPNSPGRFILEHMLKVAHNPHCLIVGL